MRARQRARQSADSDIGCLVAFERLRADGTLGGPMVATPDEDDEEDDEDEAAAGEGAGAAIAAASDAVVTAGH